MGQKYQESQVRRLLVGLISVIPIVGLRRLVFCGRGGLGLGDCYAEACYEMTGSWVDGAPISV